MQIERVVDLEISGAKLIEFGSFQDERGYFMEPFRLSQVQEVLPDMTCCVQVNQSMSKSTTLRGLHWQTHPPMGKLVRVLSGEMLDLLLDVRPHSKTFGLSLAVPIKDERTWIWVPAGVAHGNYFPVETRIEYLCSAEYNKSGEHGINPLSVFELSSLGAESAIISDKDINAPTFEQWKAQQ